MSAHDHNHYAITVPVGTLPYKIPSFNTITVELIENHYLLHLRSTFPVFRISSVHHGSNKLKISFAPLNNSMIMKIKSVSLVTSTVQALNSDVFMGTQSVKHASSQVNTRKKNAIPPPSESPLRIPSARAQGLRVTAGPFQKYMINKLPVVCTSLWVIWREWNWTYKSRFESSLPCSILHQLWKGAEPSTALRATAPSIKILVDGMLTEAV